jgi:hypothetical protein
MAIDCISKHTAFIFDRGGTTRMFQINDISEVRWNRVRDDISDANVKIAAKNCFTQEDSLAQIEPERHEMILYRGRERVWEGPITRLGMNDIQMEIHAQDVLHYASRTVMEGAYDNSYSGGVDKTAFAIDRIKAIILAEMTRKEAVEQAAFPGDDLPPYNVLPHIVYHQTPTDARTSRATPKMHKTVWEELDDMAAKGGIDYTVVGRAIHVWDTSKPLGQTRTVGQAEFLSRIQATIYGMDLVTRAIVTDGEGNYGQAGGVDSYYGLSENLETAYDETEGATPPTSAEMESQAERNMVGRNPAPLVLRVPDNSTLNPSGVLSIADLVPGVFIPLRAKILIRTFNQMQKLDRMSVVETSRSEKVSVTMSPATQPDEPEEP